jgi:soluble lytic murein transglycosylase-like protein
MAESDPIRPEPALGIRHDAERRHTRRRGLNRKSPDRRRGERRRRRFRTWLLAAATLASPSQVTTAPQLPNVFVTMDDFIALPPDEAYEELIQKAAETYELDPDLIRAVMETESAFNPTVVSPVGAQGLMQLMPELGREMGVLDPFDPAQNVMGGARYLRQLLDAQRGNIPLALASYNAGPGNVARYRGIPPFEETRNYVKKITRLIAEDAAND